MKPSSRPDGVAAISPSNAAASYGPSSRREARCSGPQTPSASRQPELGPRGGSARAVSRSGERGGGDWEDGYERDAVGGGGDEGYYYYDDGEGDDAEYEYYEEEDVDGDDGYYNADEYYEGDGGGDMEDGYIYLPDTESPPLAFEDDAGDGGVQQDEPPIEEGRRRSPVSYARSLRSLTPGAALSFAGSLPTAVPRAILAIPSVLARSASNLPNSLSGTSNNVKVVNVNITASVMVLTTVVVGVIARSILSGSIGGRTFNLGSRGGEESNVGSQKKKRNKTNKTRIKPRWKILFSDVRKRNLGDDVVSSFDDGNGVYHLDDDSNILDLDAVDTTSKRKERPLSMMYTLPARLAPLGLAPAAGALGNMWIWICAHASAVKTGSKAKGKAKKDDLSEKMDSMDVDNSVNEGDDSRRMGKVTTESHESLKQECEAALHMLHEARLELRRLQLHTPKGDQEESQRQQMEALTKKLEARYSSQMHEQVERLRNETREKVQSEVEEEMETKLRGKMQGELEAQRVIMEERLQEEMETHLSVVKEEMDANFQQAVDKAASEEAANAVGAAVEKAVEEERRRSQQEMERVREGIKKVLERERRLMKEQTREAIVKVREWVEKERRGRLLKQARELQEEAERFGRGRARGRERRGEALGKGGRGGVAGTAMGREVDRHDLGGRID